MPNRDPDHRIAPHMRDRARQLREQMTIPEAMLWNVLKGRRLGGLKFRKQHPIGAFVVDFYCAEASLVIELDGESHVGQADEDAKRQSELERQGFTVFRVTNDDVLKCLEAVADGILRVAEMNLKSRSVSIPCREANDSDE